METVMDRTATGIRTPLLTEQRDLLKEPDNFGFPSWIGAEESRHSRRKSIYIAGPMRGYEEFNFPAFDSAAEMLRKAGWDVRSPADHDREGGFDPTLGMDMQPNFDITEAFRWDVATLLDIDAVYFLDGWEASQGANTEHAIAVSIGVHRIYQKPRDEVQYFYLPHIAYRRT